MRHAACHATLTLGLLAALVACGGGEGGEPPPVVANLCPAAPPVAVDGPAWWGFGRDAQHTGLGEITLPDHFRLLDVRGNRVLGVQMDSLDVQSVAVFDLIESSPAR